MTQRPPPPSREDAMEQALFNKLSSVAMGMDEYGRPVSRQEQLAAYDRLTEMRVRRENQRLAELKMSNDRAVEDRRLDMEEERLKIQKAEVVVRALEVAVQGGVDSATLLEAVRGLSVAMLPGSASASTLLLERKEK